MEPHKTYDPERITPFTMYECNICKSAHDTIAEAEQCYSKCSI